MTMLIICFGDGISIFIRFTHFPEKLSVSLGFVRLKEEYIFFVIQFNIVR